MSVPNEFLCPITMMIMRDPVIISDGYSYERAAILQWLSRNPFSPLTRQPIDINFIQINYALRAAIERYHSESVMNIRPSAPPYEVYYVQPSVQPSVQPIQVKPTAPPFLHENYQPSVGDNRISVIFGRAICLSFCVFIIVNIIITVIQSLRQK